MDRFKSTEAGLIPEDWNLVSLGQIADVSAGGTPSRAKPDYWNGGIPWVTTSEVDFCVITEAQQFISETGLKNSAAKLLRPGTLLMALYGQGKTRGKVGVLGIEATTNQACAAISIHQQASAKFVFYFLASQYEAIRALSNSGNQENLNSTIVRSICIFVPPKFEQEAIAEALSDADALIESLESLIVKKRAIKQGAMQELLSGRRRLPGNAGEWSLVSLGSLGPWVGGGTPSMKREDYWTNGTVPWVSSADIRMGEISTDLRNITERAVSESSARLIPTSSVAIVTRSGILRRFLPVHCLSEPVAINQDIKALLPNNRAHGRFVAHSLIHHNDAILSTCLKSGTTVESIEMSWLKKFQIGLPPTERELNQVSDALDEFDADIRALEGKLHKARQIKQGMMQDLLTGRVRLI